jgi:Domain of unknown function (DUF4337)
MSKSPSFPAPAEKTGEKRTLWETIIVSTPVVLTVIATILAGLSNSELNLAQYSRALAAQMQSKASDQWSYFQAKKLRSEQSKNTAEILQSILQPVPFTVADLGSAGNRLVAQMKEVQSSAESPDTGQHLSRVMSLVGQIKKAATQPDQSDALAAYGRGEMPKIEDQPIQDPQVVDAMRNFDSHASDTDLEHEAGKIPQESLDQAIAVANANITAFSDALDKADQSHAGFGKLSNDISTETTAFDSLLTPGDSIAIVRNLASQLTGAVSVAQLKYEANRYNAEARYNQVVAQLYEIQVRKDGFTSDRHRARSREFFYGMLAAQAGVTIATFALAVRRRSVLWGLAASAGLAAITFATYVYVFV